MAQFKKPQIDRVKLPSTANEPEADQAWVDIRSTVTLGDLDAVAEIDNDVKAGIATLARLIVTWNYTDEGGQTIPITPESINNLEKVDWEFLDKYINDKIASQQEGLADTEKKTSSATSTPPSTAVKPPSDPQPTT